MSRASVPGSLTESSSCTPASREAGVQGIVLTHGSLCFGLVDAVRKIVGEPGPDLTPVSNEGRGPKELEELVRDLAMPGPTIIFADLGTGSCALAARLASRDPRGTRILFGVNLAILLDFIFHRQMPVDELVERLIDKGRAAIGSHQGMESRERGNRTLPRG